MADIIVTDIPPRVQYTSAGGVGPFAYAFPIFAATDLNVYLTPNGTVANDVNNILTYNVDYTVTNAVAPTVGGNVTLINASAAGDIITIVRNMPDDRLNNYLAGGLFQATDVNTDFDRTVMMAQQNKMYDQNVGVHYNLTANPIAVTDTVLPLLPANAVWMKAADGNSIVAVTTTGSVNPYTVALPTTDNAAARFDGVGGSLQNSGVLISDTNDVTGVLTLRVANFNITANSIIATNANGSVFLSPLGVGIAGVTGGKALNLYNVGNAAFTGLVAPAGATNVTFTLPTADGAANTLVMTSGAAVFSFSTITGIAATKAQMIAAVNAVAPVVPSEMQFHPGVAKAYVNFTPGTPPVINEAYNVAGVARNADGDYTITFTTAFANANYVLSGSAQYAAGPGIGLVLNFAGAANPNLVGSCNIQTRRVSDDALFQGVLVTCAFFGTQ